MDTAAIQFDKIDAKQEFTVYVSRDGLMKPSDVVYITCTIVYAAYKSIKNCDEAYQYLVNSSNPRNVFVKYFMNSIEDNNALEHIMKSEFLKEHLFSSFVSKIMLFCLTLWPKTMQLKQTVKFMTRRNGSLQIARVQLREKYANQHQIGLLLLCFVYFCIILKIFKTS